MTTLDEKLKHARAARARLREAEGLVIANALSLRDLTRNKSTPRAMLLALRESLFKSCDAFEVEHAAFEKAFGEVGKDA